MPICEKCGTKFGNRAWIDGKEQTMHTRKYCLVCSPFGSRKRCGPKTGLEIKSKGNSVEYVCNKCTKKFTNKNAQHTCPKCKSKEVRNKRKNFAITYKGGKCEICGYNKCDKALSFHHKNPDNKKFILSLNWEKAFERVKEEVDKCVLLCMNCHAEVHAGVTQIPK